MDQFDGPSRQVEGPAEESRTAELQALMEEEAAPEEPPLLPAGEPMRKIFRALGLIEQIVGSLLLIMVLVLVLAQVAQRYLPGASPWTGELARLSMVWGTFLLAGYLIAYAPHHISIQIIDYVAKGRWLASIKLFVSLVILLTSLALLYGSYTLVTSEVAQVTPAGGIPLSFVYAIPLVGWVLVIVRVILSMVAKDIPAFLGRDGEAS